MKTANELAQEYFAKTPMERLHLTLQDYVYDYQKSKINDLHIANLNIMRNKKSLVKHNDEMFKKTIKQDRCIRELRSDIDELQKRISKAVEKLHDICPYEYDTEAMKKIGEIKEILK